MILQRNRAAAQDGEPYQKCRATIHLKWLGDDCVHMPQYTRDPSLHLKHLRHQIKNKLAMQVRERDELIGDSSLTINWKEWPKNSLEDLSSVEC